MPTSSAEPPVLDVRSLTAGYVSPVVHDVDLNLHSGQVVAVVGPNGAGKTTLLKAIAGVVRIFAGQVRLRSTDVTGAPLERLARLGVGYVPQLDDVFDSLRVRENLDMGGYLLSRRDRAARMEQVLEVFPPLRERLHRYVETLSGGERKMTAIARVLMLNPPVLLLDEPTASLSPELTAAVLQEQVRALADLGHAVLLVEQKAVAALEVADWAAIMVGGRVVVSAPARQVLETPRMREIFLGGSTKEELASSS
jgi:ABC-type branched-subunit amino acid transport system ATPase component